MRMSFKERSIGQWNIMSRIGLRLTPMELVEFPVSARREKLVGYRS